MLKALVLSEPLYKPYLFDVYKLSTVATLINNNIAVVALFPTPDYRLQTHYSLVRRSFSVGASSAEALAKEDYLSVLWFTTPDYRLQTNYSFVRRSFSEVGSSLTSH
ncbi:hypothetical protein SAMN02745131_01345 [Flavisolibacter ginsengisoli DSM 18119]|uniref:Uncharacterized protein n=1 Tax=Flavisolibacter ginsengisoli DSM 18119 TaxID=1121884 RepID=A0A1M4X5M8_9BACT|nr:hypothetical protein SAMN02745131_01345 [Flavisolibacter ginsengisoli DSM 18119]